VLRKSKTSISSLIEKIDWLMIEPLSNRSMLGMEEVAVGFYPSKKGEDKINQVRIRIGKKILDQLKWKHGDKIYVYNDPDDLMLFRLCNPGSKNGWTLSQETNSTSCRIHLRWPYEHSLEKKKTKAVNYEIYHNEQIIFKVGSDNIFE
jgi:hypothetical protein